MAPPAPLSIASAAGRFRAYPHAVVLGRLRPILNDRSLVVEVVGLHESLEVGVASETHGEEGTGVPVIGDQGLDDAHTLAEVLVDTGTLLTQDDPIVDRGEGRVWSA